MISINATLVVQVVNFLILIWILNRLLFKPIFKIIEDREEALDHDKAAMDRLRAKAKQKARDVDMQLASARIEASRLKDEARDRASDQAGEIIGKAQEEARTHVEGIKAETARQAAEARAELDEFKQSIVEMVTLKVLGRNVS